MTGPFRPGRRLSCLALLIALPLTACAAGYQAETSRVRTTLTSVSGAVGDLTLRNMFVVGPGNTGSSVGFYAAIFNGGPSDDRLVSISSPAAAEGTLPSNTAIPSGGSLFYNNGDPDVPQLVGLKTDLLIGQTVSVTMKFAGAGEVTIAVPIENGHGLAGPIQSPTPTSSPSPSGKPSPSTSVSGSASPSPSASPSASPPSASASPSAAP